MRQTRHLTGCVFIVSDVQRRGQENDAVIQKGDAEKIIHTSADAWRASSTATVEYPSGRTCRRIHRSIALSTNHPNTSCVPRTRPSAPCASARAIPEVTISVIADARARLLDAPAFTKYNALSGATRMHAMRKTTVPWTPAITCATSVSVRLSTPTRIRSSIRASKTIR